MFFPQGLEESTLFGEQSLRGVKLNEVPLVQDENLVAVDDGVQSERGWGMGWDWVSFKHRYKANRQHTVGPSLDQPRPDPKDSNCLLPDCMHG